MPILKPILWLKSGDLTIIMFEKNEKLEKWDKLL